MAAENAPLVCRHQAHRLLRSTRAAYYLALRFYKARGQLIIWLCAFIKHAVSLLSGSALYKAREQLIIWLCCAACFLLC